MVNRLHGSAAGPAARSSTGSSTSRTRRPNQKSGPAPSTRRWQRRPKTIPSPRSRHTRYADLDDKEFIKVVGHNIEAVNHATRNIAPDMMRLHVCWGNYVGPHTHDFPVSGLVGSLARLRAQALLFEGANPRHDHEWEAWKAAKIPDYKILIPGVGDSTNNFVEHPRLVAQRLLRYADIVRRERVIGGSDCGFATWSPMEYQAQPSVAMAKLKAIADGARIASKQLWN